MKKFIMCICAVFALESTTVLPCGMSSQLKESKKTIKALAKALRRAPATPRRDNTMLLMCCNEIEKFEELAQDACQSCLSICKKTQKYINIIHAFFGIQ